MKRIFLVLVFFSILIISFSSPQAPGQKEKNILILLSMVPSTPAYRVMLDGIREQISKEFGNNYTLHIEYLETERFPKGQYPGERFDVYNHKYRNIKLDLLICIGLDVISTIKQQADEQILSLPAISIDLDFSSFGYPWDLALNANTTVLRIKMDPVSTIASALELFPGTRYIYVISGQSKTDELFLHITKEAAKKFEDKRTFRFISGLTMDEVLQSVRNLPDSSIVLVANFNTDANQVPYYNPESLRLISKASDVPVFSYSDMGLGEGSVGGYVLSFNKIGQIAGESAGKILRGIKPNAIIISPSSFYEHLYDWKVLKKWNLTDPDRIHKDGKVLFEEVSVFKKYKMFIFLGSFFLLLQSLLIFSLILMVRRQKIMHNQLRASENKFRELIREDRILRTGQLTANLAHELNQPLTAILSTAQAGIRFIESNNMDPGLMKEIFQNIVEDDKRTAAILGSIRGMLKLEKREKELVDLNAVVGELINIFRSEATINNIHLNINLLNEAVWVFADHIQIQQVLLNFLLNASQSLNRSKVETKTITIVEFIQDENVGISVRDNGPGIDETIKPNLFNPFITSKNEGFGIGLAVSRTIIDDHHGIIQAENLPEGGADFSFMLKVCTDDRKKM